MVMKRYHIIIPCLEAAADAVHCIWCAGFEPGVLGAHATTLRRRCADLEVRYPQDMSRLTQLRADEATGDLMLEFITNEGFWLHGVLLPIQAEACRLVGRQFSLASPAQVSSWHQHPIVQGLRRLQGTSQSRLPSQTTQAAPLAL